MISKITADFMMTAAFGALCGELLHWYDIRNKMTKKENLELLTSPYY